ncbi:hypothetical protein SYNPS1DRAFT_29600 [Syncephalis pseudoplumigaleata]|uniref:SCP domain-containing protein n=1 Tax=Syncephalis pseudoplumigaleata TaxID=1712513 RepID=A0A4V1J1D1_9FUNG|nr:hypothetical protein SYNPS1DRAFT_29600 [Syncephalis pseudoplumigaleata]|eukprot:RKP24639.1 hypothetical protein SYNPS1DRAFT_29600 [Syncephalis pseudoplumigaleata]
MRASTLAITLLATVAALAPSIAADDSIEVKQLLCAINKYRKQNNRPFLAFYSGLNGVAQTHNNLMAARNQLKWQFDDEAPLYDRIKDATKTDAWRATAQLVARGYASDDDFVKTMASDAGTKDIFNGNFTHVGVARNSTGQGPWWTQTLGYLADTQPTTVECPQ